jgi:hypothetical protein
VKNFIAELDKVAGKIPWQELQIEYQDQMVLKVQLPLKNVQDFESKIKNSDGTRQHILTILKVCGGELVK